MFFHIISSLFKKNKECTHPHVSPDKESQYCPDCGKYVENRWYLTRCDCCNVKRVSTIKNGNVVPNSKYCPNCGSEHFHVERIKTINFIDINFAVLVKQIIEPEFRLFKDITQSWLERDNTETVRLLSQSMSEQNS